MLELKVLGTLEALDAGERLDLRRGLPEKVFAMLITRKGDPLKADELVDRIWPGNPPENARAVVYNAICALKKMRVGPRREPLVRKNAQGYFVETKAALVDLTRFTETLELADEAVDRGDLEAAWKETDAALSLWHGDEPFGGLDCPALSSLALELKQRRAEAREEWCHIGQRLGRHRKVLPLLRLLSGAHPLNESVHEKLMRSLEQTGRRAEALAVYDSIRREVSTELGVDLGPDIQALYQRILGPSKKALNRTPSPGSTSSPRELAGSPASLESRGLIARDSRAFLGEK